MVNTVRIQFEEDQMGSFEDCEDIERIIGRIIGRFIGSFEDCEDIEDAV
jgi:hypothetical protein